jgi:hypothetical protein
LLFAAWRKRTARVFGQRHIADSQGVKRSIKRSPCMVCHRPPFSLPNGAPKWIWGALQVPRGLPVPDWRAPSFERAVAALCDRHKLPRVRQLVVSIGLYILTSNPAHIANLSLSGVLAGLGTLPRDQNSCAYDSLDISVGGIDEYVTEQDWIAIWTDLVKPRQDFLLEEQGRAPRGRRSVDLKRLREAMPLFREMVLNERRIGDAISSLSAGTHRHIEKHDLSRESRSMRDLRLLLTPRDALP